MTLTYSRAVKFGCHKVYRTSNDNRMATDDKYDRQLRLWGKHGQKKLMEANILLVNADALGTEILKNLVLPGVGKFTIVDDNTISDKDVSSNFFVHMEDVGKSRCKIATKLLCEMNNDVVGVAIHDSITNLLNNDGSYLNQFNIVIVANVVIELATIAEICWKRNIPLLIARTYGLLGYYRLQISCHNIIEGKPEAVKYDLRISNPFPALKQFIDSFVLDQLDDAQFGHVPYVVILHKALIQWKSLHNGSAPSNHNDKEEFKRTLKMMGRKADEYINFNEAISEAYRSYVPLNLDDTNDLLKSLPNINELQADTGTKKLTAFDILLYTLQQFMDENDGEIPLSGAIPDMTASSSVFIQLQKIYEAKAASDRILFKQYLRDISNKLYVSSNRLMISDATIDLFCRNVYNLRSIHTSSVLDEMKQMNTEAIDEALLCDVGDDEATYHHKPIRWYIPLRAADNYYRKFNKFPGAILTDVNNIIDEEDTRILWEDIKCMSACLQVGDLTKDYAAEIVRYNNGSLHVVAALIAGVVSQEAVKIIAQQYVPINNTYIYNGITGVSCSYEL